MKQHMLPNSDTIKEFAIITDVSFAIRMINKVNFQKWKYEKIAKVTYKAEKDYLLTSLTSVKGEKRPK